MCGVVVKRCDAHCRRITTRGWPVLPACLPDPTRLDEMRRDEAGQDGTTKSNHVPRILLCGSRVPGQLRCVGSTVGIEDTLGTGVLVGIDEGLERQT